MSYDLKGRLVERRDQNNAVTLRGKAKHPNQK
jgi:YD repeat-containing protein